MKKSLDTLASLLVPPAPLTSYLAMVTKVPTF